MIFLPYLWARQLNRIQDRTCRHIPQQLTCSEARQNGHLYKPACNSQCPSARHDAWRRRGVGTKVANFKKKNRNSFKFCCCMRFVSYTLHCSAVVRIQGTNSVLQFVQWHGSVRKPTSVAWLLHCHCQHRVGQVYGFTVTWCHSRTECQCHCPRK